MIIVLVGVDLVEEKKAEKVKSDWGAISGIGRIWVGITRTNLVEWMVNSGKPGCEYFS